ncbi:tetratricopeptide repeat protein [Desulforhopalus singaporensis]|uniref:Predicted methyltransferase, contains TPR repeat n=1 Tax=Desulforhopalus singaporensis TaxID=91360 RepID=A0A1H0UH52_9BACT|nr:tetratricopeptide repeat protein [Desulforhopalus singaporensis]SDP65509.1 Predicted methyltransferase, contains TPR repeat [Desulforhopalus singaporensis]
MESRNLPSTDELNEIFGAACASQQQGALTSAQAGFRKLLSWFPEAPVLHYNLGLVYYESGDFEKSSECFAKGASLAPDDTDIIFNLALCRKQCGDMQGAIEGYRRLLQLTPDSVDALYNLGGCYKDQKEYAKAIGVYLRVLELAAEHLGATKNLAYVYHLTGDGANAVAHYQKALQLAPGDTSITHMLAALTGQTPESTPHSYIAEMFDEYSCSFDRSLVDELEYLVPAKIRAVIDREKLWQQHFRAGLDLGCGTGLSGESIKDLLEILDGVDLSPKMLEIANEKNIYTNLYPGAIDDFMNNRDNRYDFIQAADVFAYLGELEGILRLARSCVADGGLFCFSTERCQQSGYILGSTGRFAHGEKYVEQAARKAGWRLLVKECISLRKEKDEWVEGQIWFWQPLI